MSGILYEITNEIARIGVKPFWHVVTNELHSVTTNLDFSQEYWIVSRKDTKYIKTPICVTSQVGEIFFTDKGAAQRECDKKNQKERI